MPITFLQRSFLTTDTNASSTESLSLLGTVEGSLIVALYTAYQNDQPSPIVNSVDMASESFYLAGRVNRGIGDLEAGVFYLQNTSAGNKTIDFNLSAPNGTIINLQVFELLGVNNVSPIEFVVTDFLTTTGSELTLNTGTKSVNNVAMLAIAGTGGDLSSDINLGGSMSTYSPFFMTQGEQQNGANVGTVVVSNQFPLTVENDLVFTFEPCLYGAVAIAVGFTPGDPPPQRFKFLVKSSAVGTTDVKVVVWTVAGSGFLVGTYLLEVHEQMFEETLENGKAVIYVNCPPELGLVNGTSVRGLMSNGIHTTGVTTGIVEAGYA